MSWSLIINVAAEHVEILAAELFDLGALGVETHEPGMQLMPGTPALPEGGGRCVAHFRERATALEAAQGVRETALFAALEVPPPLEVPEQDWARAWRAHHRALRVGPRSWVHPPWEKPDAAPGEALVCIDPGMAFGTGQHPTTALCLERVDELLARRPGADLLDVGTGSGVIALLAKKLGARRVVGTENDPLALRIAAENEARNGIAGIEWALQDPAQVPGEFQIVVANILLNTLTELAPQIAAKVAPGGRLVLSGLLALQGGLAEAAYEPLGLRPAGRRQREGWLRVELVRP